MLRVVQHAIRARYGIDRQASFRERSVNREQLPAKDGPIAVPLAGTAVLVDRNGSCWTRRRLSRAVARSRRR